jgi:hypothetical protein
MKILDKIVADKKNEIDNLSSKIPISVCKIIFYFLENVFL